MKSGSDGGRKLERVLVTNGFLRKTLAVVRDLGKHHIAVTVGECTRPNPSAWSKYAVESIRYPHPIHERAAFIQWLLTTLETGAFDAFLPMDDDTMDIAVELQPQISRWTRILLPGPDVYRRLRDKASALIEARDSGFFTPETHLVVSLQQLSDIMENVSYPVVLKPTHSSGSRGLRVASSPKQLLDMYQILAEEYEELLLQTYIPTGPRIDVCLLCDHDHRPLASFVQRELRHFPMPHGPSTAQESMHDDELVKKCFAFAERLGWTGIVEIEFMRAGDNGDLHFMEANPRFWNSLQLANFAGVPFAWILYDYLVHHQRPMDLNYEDGIRCRNLLPTDLLHWFGQPGRFLSIPRFFRTSIAGRDDIMTLSDIGPTFGFAFALLRYALQPGALKKAFKR